MIFISCKCFGVHTEQLKKTVKKISDRVFKIEKGYIHKYP